MGGWTQTPNFIYDLMPEMKEAEIKVVMTIVRETIGWKRDAIDLTVPDLMRLTKLARASVVAGLKAALEHGVLARQENGKSYTYTIVEPCAPSSVQNLNQPGEGESVQNLYQSDNAESVQNSDQQELLSVQNSDYQSVQNLNSVEININTNKTPEEKTGIAAEAAPPAAIPSEGEPKEPPTPKRSRKSQAPPPSEAPPKEPTEWQEFVGAFCWLCYEHKEVRTLTEAKRGALLSEAKLVHADGYTVQDLKEWYKRIWSQSWQWRRDHSRPQPADVRSSIAQLRAETPEGFEMDGLASAGGNRNGSNAAQNRQAVASVFAKLRSQQEVTHG